MTLMSLNRGIPCHQKRNPLIQSLRDYQEREKNSILDLWLNQQFIDCHQKRNPLIQSLRDYQELEKNTNLDLWLNQQFAPSNYFN